MRKNLVIASSLFLTLSMIPVFAQTPASDTRKMIHKEIREDKKELKSDVKDLKSINSKGNGIKLIGADVTAVSSSSITVSKDGKTYTVTVDTSTKLRRHFWGKSMLSEISVGDHVNVWGKFTNSDKTQIAAMMIRDVSIMKRHGVFFGDITVKNTDNFVIKSVNRGNQTVSISSTTKFVGKNGTAISLTNLAVGDRVRVRGLWDKALSRISEIVEVKDFSR